MGSGTKVLSHGRAPTQSPCRCQLNPLTPRSASPTTCRDHATLERMHAWHCDPAGGALQVVLMDPVVKVMESGVVDGVHYAWRSVMRALACTLLLYPA